MAPCQECLYLSRGFCLPNNSDCICVSGYEGYLCRIVSTTAPQTSSSSSSDRNWTIAVAVVSAIAGLLLIISLVLCISVCVKQSQASSGDFRKGTGRNRLRIPRAHPPAAVTVNRDFSGLDDFSLDNTDDEQFADATDSPKSSESITYNTTYRTTGNPTEANFGIFDELEKRTPLPKGYIPRPVMRDMIGTFNSFPAEEQPDDPSGTTSAFADSPEVEDIQLVTDMLDDMTKDDNMDDEFFEATNPNFEMPESVLKPETKSSGWFSVCLYEKIFISILIYFSSFEILN